MKQIIAIVKPFLAEKVLEGLKLAPLEALVVREVKGFGRQKSYLDQYDDSEFSLAFLPKVEITMWVDDGRANEIVRKIVQIARTGRIGDGKVFVLGSASSEQVIDLRGILTPRCGDASLHCRLKSCRWLRASQAPGSEHLFEQVAVPAGDSWHCWTSSELLLARSR